MRKDCLWRAMVWTTRVGRPSVFRSVPGQLFLPARRACLVPLLSNFGLAVGDGKFHDGGMIHHPMDITFLPVEVAETDQTAVFWNRRIRGILGYSMNRVVGRRCSSLARRLMPITLTARVRGRLPDGTQPSRRPGAG